MDRKHSGGRDFGHEELDWEAFWNEHEASIKQALAEEMQAYFNLFSSSSYTPERRQENLEGKIQKEKAFVKLLLPKLKELLGKSKKVLMLVDVDETIGGGYHDKEQKFHTIVRPAFLAILNQIQPFRAAGKIEIGLLTTRGIPKEQLDDPANLQKIKSFIHPDHIYSTRKYRSDGDSSEEVEEIGKSEDSVLRTGLTEADYREFPNVGSVVKLKALQDIKKGNPEVAILVLDDDRYTPYLDEHKDLHGVKVGDDATFWVR